jgi:hypothetical protein
MTVDNRRKNQEFNEVLAEAIDDTLRELFSPQVLETVYKVLLERYDVVREEVPYRMETAFKLLTDAFGPRGAGTIGRSIVRRLYQKLDLHLDESPGLELTDYIEIAKSKLVQEDRSGQSTNLG